MAKRTDKKEYQMRKVELERSLFVQLLDHTCRQFTLRYRNLNDAMTLQGATRAGEASLWLSKPSLEWQQKLVRIVITTMKTKNYRMRR